jgi:hypothetical protein
LQRLNAGTRLAIAMAGAGYSAVAFLAALAAAAVAAAAVIIGGLCRARLSRLRRSHSPEGFDV